MRKLPFMDDMNQAELDRFEKIYLLYKQKVNGKFSTKKANEYMAKMFMNKDFEVHLNDINLLPYILMRANEDGCEIKHHGFVAKICPLGLDDIAEYFSADSLKDIQELLSKGMYSKLEYRVTIQHDFSVDVLFDFTCTKENFLEKFKI